MPLGCVDHGALLRALVRDAVLVAADDFTSYDVSYPEFLKYFNSCGPLTNHHLIIATNFAYGWMPTILDFASREFEKGVAYLEIAKAGGKLSIAELTTLAKIVNNSTCWRIEAASFCVTLGLCDFGFAGCKVSSRENRKRRSSCRAVSRIQRLHAGVVGFTRGR